jgi:hypothetical protein
MAKEKKDEFNPQKLMEITKQSKVGAIVGIGNYEDFSAMMEAQDNIADIFGEVEKTIAQKLQVGKDIKAVVDAVARPLKKAETDLRGYLTQWLLDKNIERLDGEQTKSITLQHSKTTKGILSTKQIMVKRKYVNISELSKDDLIEMLEAQGVKTRVQTKEVETTKDASVRVQK